MAEIRGRQASDVNVRRQVAARRYYKVAKLAHFGGFAFGVVFALAAPLVLLFAPDAGPVLGAVAGAWMFISRVGLERIKASFQLKGAKAQELFDCNVLGVGWNEALARPLSEEEIRDASKNMGKADRSWYPAEVSLPWPQSVLLCQRSNANWARRQHFVFGSFLAGLAIFWSVFGVVIAMAHGASLAEYLTTIALPSLPAVLDGIEISGAHRRAGRRRQDLEDQADAWLRGDPEPNDLRELQDQLFNLRSAAPLVPEWFYKVIKNKYELSMRYAAERLAAELLSQTTSEEH
jgi:hypothetical protein